jgi:hypothetical protein
MMMLWMAYVLLFIMLLALAWRSLQINKLSQELHIIRKEFAKEGDVIEHTVNALMQRFDTTLYYYRPVIHDRAAMEALALENLAQDLRVMSKFVGYGESAGWGRAFDILALYRIRLIVGRVVLSASASDEFKEGMDKLVASLEAFEFLRGARRTNIREQAPYELDNDKWPHLQLAQMKVASTQEEAQKLLQLLEQDNWRVAPQP